MDLDPTPADTAGEEALEPSGEVAPATDEARWLVPGDVETVAELPGRYYQPFALPGQISVMTLGDLEEGTGDYALYRSCGIPTCIAESGTYHAVPENPAVGFAFFTLHSGGAVAPETYVIDLLWRAAGGEVLAVQVRRLLPTDGFGPTTIFWRLPPPSPGVIGMTGDAVEREAEGGAIESAWDVVPDLTGTFVRPVPVYGDIGALTLRNVDTDVHPRAVGDYRAAYPYCLPWCIPEDGTFEVELASTVTGTGVLRLSSAVGGAEKRYVVLAIWRTPSGRAGAIQLQRIHPFGAVGPPFTMYAQWWTSGDAVPAAATGGACTYYQGLAEYFAIRALQCAYSVCYPLSPVYGYWAEYYQGLADAYCEQD